MQNYGNDQAFPGFVTEVETEDGDAVDVYDGPADPEARRHVDGKQDSDA
jgi:hypothetical protein